MFFGLFLLYYSSNSHSSSSIDNIFGSNICVTQRDPEIQRHMNSIWRELQYIKHGSQCVANVYTKGLMLKIK